MQPPAISASSNVPSAPTESSSSISNNLQSNSPTSEQNIQSNYQSTPVDSLPINQPILINKTPLTTNNQLTTNQQPNQLNIVQPTIDDQAKNSNSLTTLTTSTGAIAPNLEVTTQPQIVKAVVRKKPASKIKRKNRTNQHDFGTRKGKKDLLEAIER